MSVKLLTEWAKSENIRTLSIEAIRPHGVWTKNIGILRQKLYKKQSILNLHKSDPSRYVQDSVGYWLNDACKNQPEWVLNRRGYLEKNSKKATERMIKKAKSTFEKGSI